MFDELDPATRYEGAGDADQGMTGDLTRWLEQIGLGGYGSIFASQGIDWDVLGDLSEADLKELGLPLGDRKRLLKALAGAAPASALAAPQPAGGEGERRQLTVMFVDLIESSPLAERFDPEDMQQILHVFHQACASAIEAHEGHIAQYSGDGLLVYFGYPRAHEDDGVRAVLAGLDLVANLNVANDGIEAEHKVRLRVRIGVETGLVVAGEVGAGASLDRQAIVGETPIVAARLQTLAPPDSVIVGPATARLIQGAFVLESMGRHALKGVSAPIDIHRVVSRTQDLDRFEIRAERGLTPLIGRTAELDMLRQRWRQACDGEMRCVLLTGEPGIGKSRTLRAFRELLEGDTHEVISFHCSSYYRDSSFWPVLQRLQRSFGLDAAAAYTEADLDRLEQALDGFGVDKSEAALVLSNLLGIPTGGRYPTIDMSGPAFKRQTLNLLTAMVEDMTGRRPVLLVVEDAHWIDPSTLELMRVMLEQLTTTRLMMLVTARPEFKPGWTYPHLVQLNLDRLSRRDRFEMIEQLTAGKPMPAFVLDQIVAKTDGVPLFVEELTKAVLQGDLLRDAGSRYELKGVALSISIPDTLQGSLLSRLDRLDPGVKEIAQTAAIIGRDFDRGLLSHITAKPEPELQAALDRLIEAEIILPAPGPGLGAAYVFRHALIQDIAYQSLLLARRRRYHGLIAEALEAHYPEIVERQPEVLAQNLAASETPDRAVDYWRQAGERALARAAYEEAVSHAEAGIALTQSLGVSGHDRAVRIAPLLLVRGRSEYRLGNPRAIETYRQAAQLAREEEQPALLAEAALGFEEATLYLGFAGKPAVALLDEALAAIGDDETIDRCRLLSRLASSLHTTGAVERAGDVTRQAITLARKIGDANGLLDALMCDLLDIGVRPLPLAAFPERARHLDEIRQIAERCAETYVGLANARCLACSLEIGEFQIFEAALARYGQVVAAEHDRVHRWVETGGRAMRAILVGDFALAERLSEDALQQAESVDAELPTGVYGMQMFTIRREQGRLAEVAPLIKRFVDENPEEKAWRPGLMLIASDVGFEAQASRMLDAMAEEGFPVPMDGKRLVTWTYLAEVAARLGHREHAQRIYDSLLPFQAQAVTVPAATLCCGAAARYLGMLASALGDWSAAEEHFEYALQMEARLQARPWLAHSRHEYALMLSARNRKGDKTRAAGLLAEAAETAKDLNMFALIERIGATSGSKTRLGAAGKA